MSRTASSVGTGSRTVTSWGTRSEDGRQDEPPSEWERAAVDGGGRAGWVGGSVRAAALAEARHLGLDGPPDGGHVGLLPGRLGGVAHAADDVLTDQILQVDGVVGVAHRQL